MIKQLFATLGILFFFLVGCNQQSEQSTNKPGESPTSSNTPPPIRAIPPAQPDVKPRTPHYKFEKAGDYGYETLDESKQIILVRYLGLKDGQHSAVINPGKTQHSILSCGGACTTITATSFYGSQRMGTETYTGPGSVEEVIMQDVAANLLKTGEYKPDESN